MKQRIPFNTTLESSCVFLVLGDKKLIGIKLDVSQISNKLLIFKTIMMLCRQPAPRF